ncbi:hypothetical protein OOK36_56560 [Streptomyces sp. NBC_00365]|uniref:hypothetical protein n=1 Tax=Streptomyces sp. NBC_00365 TaxID=2975726 RepID=UPI00225AA3A3|nr:hypothetical protein [Streptomyces sp. NBC_00365]MCX5097863.1 hypothetical protein [Streptomyces sp. NBC_00365]
MVVQGAEGDWVGHAMGFSEWLYRYLIGEEMAGWDSAAFYPGPVRLEYRRQDRANAPRRPTGPSVECEPHTNRDNL